jgi:hypothetical protein
MILSSFKLSVFLTSCFDKDFLTEINLLPPSTDFEGIVKLSDRLDNLEALDVESFL